LNWRDFGRDPKDSLVLLAIMALLDVTSSYLALKLRTDTAEGNWVAQGFLGLFGLELGLVVTFLFVVSIGLAVYGVCRLAQRFSKNELDRSLSRVLTFYGLRAFWISRVPVVLNNAVILFTGFDMGLSRNYLYAYIGVAFVLVEAFSPYLKRTLLDR